MEHHFNTEIAEKYGVFEAIFLHNIGFWILKNKANRQHFYEGRYWTYNSSTAFAELFPYWSIDQIKRIIKKLKDQGVIDISNFNKTEFDRTNWYSVSDEILSQYENTSPDRVKSPNRQGEIAPTIPDSKPDSKLLKEDTNVSSKKIDFDALLRLINLKTGRNFKLINKATKQKFNARLKEGYSKDDIKSAIENAVGEKFHQENNYTYLTPEFFSRANTLDKYGSKSVLSEKHNGLKPGDIDPVSGKVIAFFTDDGRTVIKGNTGSPTQYLK